MKIWSAWRWTRFSTRRGHSLCATTVAGTMRKVAVQLTERLAIIAEGAITLKQFAEQKGARLGEIRKVPHKDRNHEYIW